MVEMTAPAGLANCDFNGDGKVTKADGQALLDYVTGVLDSISNKDNADFDNDGNIDTYDAYLFFQQLNKSTVEIPATAAPCGSQPNGPGLDEYDKASDNTGTYVEGYVYADEVASAEGVKGDSHSIPVLGYYGNWTDPSMFDIGSYLEYHEAKTESRVPYMYAYNKNATKYQALTVQYAGDSGMYYFGGNPYVDETYDPNRAAINPDTTVFARATFSLIRNAADSRATSPARTALSTMIRRPVLPPLALTTTATAAAGAMLRATSVSTMPPPRLLRVRRSPSRSPRLPSTM